MGIWFGDEKKLEQWKTMWMNGTSWVELSWVHYYQSDKLVIITFLALLF